MKQRVFAIAGIFPGCHMTEILIVTQGFVSLGLKGFIKMAPAGFLARQGINDHQFGKLQKIRHTAGFFKALVEIFFRAWNLGVLPEFIPQLLDVKPSLGKALVVA